MEVRKTNWASSFKLLTLQLLILQCSLIMTAHLNPSRSSVTNGIDLVEAVDIIFNTSEVNGPHVLCPDGQYCDPGNTCCDGDQDGVYECCGHLSVRNHFINRRYGFSDYLIVFAQILFLILCF